MPQIASILATPGLTGYYFDDLAAIKAGARQDGFFYTGTPVTPGQYMVRQPGESISLILILSSGEMSFGDAVSIQYSGVVGRDPVLIARTYLPFVDDYLVPLLVGREVGHFRELCDAVEGIRLDDGKPLHTGLRYGMSQALLAAVALVQRRPMPMVIAEEFGTSPSKVPIAVLAQSGDDRYLGADKMILKSVPSIPQGLFNHVDKVGSDGAELLDYVSWLADRVARFGTDGYQPTFHLDVYGTIGEIFANDPMRITPYLEQLAIAAAPYLVRVEAPVDLGARDATLEAMCALRQEVDRQGVPVKIVADDWCNTLDDIRLFAEAGAAHMIQIKAPDLGCLCNSIDAVKVCHAHGVEAFLGGTCNGTDQSSRVTANVAIATNADLIYNKPGMGVDEGLMIVTNEMARTLAVMEGLGTGALRGSNAFTDVEGESTLRGSSDERSASS